MKKGYLKIGLMSLLFIGMNLMLSSASVAQKQQQITSSMQHDIISTDLSGCSSVQLMVSYSYNGFSYSQISSSQTITPGSTGNFSVSIPASATSIVKYFKITMTNGTHIHNISSGGGSYYKGGASGWCNSNNWIRININSPNSYFLDL